MTFKEAFAKARKEKGAGATFTWNSKEYTTNYKEEVGSKSAPSKSKKPKARPKAKSDVAKDPGKGYRKGDVTTSVRPGGKNDELIKKAKKAIDRAEKRNMGEYLDTKGSKKPFTAKKHKGPSFSMSKKKPKTVKAGASNPPTQKGTRGLGQKDSRWNKS